MENSGIPGILAGLIRHQRLQNIENNLGDSERFWDFQAIGIFSFHF